MLGVAGSMDVDLLRGRLDLGEIVVGQLEVCGCEVRLEALEPSSAGYGHDSGFWASSQARATWVGVARLRRGDGVTRW